MSENTTVQVAIGQIWTFGGCRILIDKTTSRFVTGHQVVNGAVAGPAMMLPLRGGAPVGGWEYEASQPTLTCKDDGMAGVVEGFLRGKGVNHVIRQGNLVAVAVTPKSVHNLANEAMLRGWAHDDDALAFMAMAPADE